MHTAAMHDNAAVMVKRDRTVGLEAARRRNFRASRGPIYKISYDGLTIILR